MGIEFLTKAEELNITGEFLQRGGLNVSAILPNPIYANVRRDSHDQAIEMSARVESHYRETLTHQEFSGINSFYAGIFDMEQALNGVIAKTDQEELTGPDENEAISIALRSYGVARRFAIEQRRAKYDDLTERTDKFTIKRRLRTDLLKFVAGPPSLVTFPVISRATTTVNSSEQPEMACPAFRGKPSEVPRLPKQLWVAMIGIYAACGEFGSPVILDK